MPINTDHICDVCETHYGEDYSKTKQKELIQYMDYFPPSSGRGKWPVFSKRYLCEVCYNIIDKRMEWYSEDLKQLCKGLRGNKR